MYSGKSPARGLRSSWNSQCHYIYSAKANIISIDDAILAPTLNIVYVLYLDKWYIFSRLDYEAIGTNGIIIQEMNVIIICIDDALACLFATVHVYVVRLRYMHRYIL